MKKVYIVLFAILYCCVALISCTHAIEFFGLANDKLMSIILSGAFEIGQAAVLFSLLTSPKERNKVMPWVLMCILTLVQILGNVYSSYKYILSNSMDNLKFFKDPIFVWTNLPDDQANVIVTYIVGAILPVIALLLTSMVTNQLDTDKTEEKQKEQEIEKKEEIEEDKIEEKVEEKIEEDVKEEQIPTLGHPQVLPIVSPTLVPKIESQTEEVKEQPEMNLTYIDPVYDRTVEEKDSENENVEEQMEQPSTEAPVEISQDVEDIFDGGPIVPEVTYTKPKSHFINI